MKTPNYLLNFAVELMYESFHAPPRDSTGDRRLDLTDHGDVQRLVEMVDDKGKGIVAYFNWLNRRPSARHPESRSPR